MKVRSISRRASVLAAAAGASLALAALAEPEGIVEAPAGEATASEMADLARMMAMSQARGSSSGEREFPRFEDVSRGYRKVISTTDETSFYNLWVRDRDGHIIAELPRGFESRKQFFATTVGGGDLYAGLQVGDLYCYWKRFDRRLALIAPQISVKSDGDAESRASVERLFTDRVILDVPILCMGPSGHPVIDMNDLLLGNAAQFFGSSAFGLRTPLVQVDKVKAFPENVEIAYKLPGRDGRFRILHYSISNIPARGSYQPRRADERVGYFTTWYKDLGQFDRDKVWVRYITRWHLEKRDPKLRLSPPKEPIVFYVDAATPVRYRRWVKEGIEYWNKAFEQVGILGAIEVRYQDAQTGAHMEKDPEDVRYNFIRWLSNDQGTAIGPSRIHPETGQILDADIVITDGFIRGFVMEHQIITDTAMETFGPETLAWLEKNPDWDPRLRLASPAERDMILAQRAARGVVRYGGHPAAAEVSALLGENEFDGLIGRNVQMNGLCMAGQGKLAQVAAMRMVMEIGLEELLAPSLPELGDEIPPEVLELIKKQLAENPQLISQLPPEIRAKLGYGEPEGEEPEDEAKAEPAKEPARKPKSEAESLLDGLPEEFVGRLLADLVAHEVGHTLGLRHNFKASSIHTLEQFNSSEFKGRKPWGGSVMDYNGMNFRVDVGEVQGDFAMIDIGPYDLWAIEYGYTSGDPAKVAARVAEPELVYGTDEDTWGPDPLITRWDLGSDPITYADQMVMMAGKLRNNLLEKWVKDGQSWSRARRGYDISLWLHTSQMGNIARWVGGSYVNRDKKGDPNARPPIVPVEPDKQRQAMAWIFANILRDQAYGLTPELLQHMTTDRWWDDGGMATLFQDPAYAIHARIMGIQASALTMLMNPTTLQRVFDNEARVDRGEDAFTLPELFDGVLREVWSELENPAQRRYSDRMPMISSLRRSLQREHVNRLIDLSFGVATGPAGMAAANLATSQLRELHGRLDELLKNGSRLDTYSRAHLSEAKIRISKALEAQYVYNTGGAGGGTTIINIYGRDGHETPGGR
ncbi:MAG: zinc-dependent metalloprotease [Phycisphaeraceae bacterium]|nr:zinc-dependent metalloprotease [Phycisphaeraceae bacterium]